LTIVLILMLGFAMRLPNRRIERGCCSLQRECWLSSGKRTADGIEISIRLSCYKDGILSISFTFVKPVTLSGSTSICIACHPVSAILNEPINTYLQDKDATWT